MCRYQQRSSWILVRKNRPPPKWKKGFTKQILERLQIAVEEGGAINEGREYLGRWGC